MDTLQTQINTLNSKMDKLNHVIEQMGGNLAQVLAELKVSSTSGMTRSMTGNSVVRSSNPAMEHKDVLIDTNDVDSTAHSGEKALAPEVQIQRLTAQLTAAYNRIAALEEQLLAQRIH
jgi:chaperonin cofactor prefoldin